MFDIIVGIVGAFLHPVQTVRAWYDTLFKHDDSDDDE